MADVAGVDPQLLGRKLLELAVVWLLGWLIDRAVRVVARRIERVVDDGDDSTLTVEEKRGRTIAQLVRSVGRAGVLVTCVLVTFNLFVDIRPILAGVGILGLAISFGAQSLVKDFISGFFILFENQFAVGDVIEIGNHAGAVERMTLRIVALRDLQGALHIIPNGTITAVTNKTKGWSRAVVDVGVGYGADLDQALAVFRDELAAFRADPVWAFRFEGTSEVLGVQSLGDSGVIIRTVIRTAAGSQWEAAREFQRRLKNRLDDEGIEIPFPQRTLHVRRADAAELA